MHPANRKLILAYRWPLTLIALGVLLILGCVLVFFLAGSFFKKGVDGSLDASHEVLDRIEGMVAGSTRETLQTSFLADIPTIADAGGGHLELAKVDRTEVLRSEDTLTVLWDRISLGTSVAEIRVPTTYRYYVKLDDPWQIEVQDQICRVLAPKLRTSLPPAIHTHRMEKRMDNGWARFNAQEQMNALEKQLTPTLVQYAEAPALMVLVRDQARKSLGRFVRHWLLQQQAELNREIEWIDVRFQDETFEKEGEMPPLMTLHE